MRFCDQLTTRIKKRSVLTMKGISKWTELRFQDKVLCNTLEYVCWEVNPVQLLLCETCGVIDCSNEGYVHISKMGEYILWSPPPGDASKTLGIRNRLDSLSEWGSLLIPLSVWEVMVGSDLSAFPIATRQTLMLSWFLEYYRYEDLGSMPETLDQIRQRLVGGSSLDMPVILENLEKLAAWFEVAPEEPLRGNLIQANRVSEQIEILYLERPAREWPAFAITDGKVHPAFGNDWVYIEER